MQPHRIKSSTLSEMFIDNLTQFSGEEFKLPRIKNFDAELVYSDLRKNIKKKKSVNPALKRLLTDQDAGKIRRRHRLKTDNSPISGISSILIDDNSKVYSNQDSSPLHTYNSPLYFTNMIAIKRKNKKKAKSANIKSQNKLDKSGKIYDNEKSKLFEAELFGSEHSD